MARTDFLKRAEELKVRNPRAYEHTYLGIATGEGRRVVFKALRIKPIAKEDRLRFELKSNVGMDFGYVDPNAIEKDLLRGGRVADAVHLRGGLSKRDDDQADRGGMQGRLRATAS